ncbi:MAG: hypothetical protein QGG96_04750 [Candidatus Poseidoniaceae archaeon]|nr:hypothetical protein [Candidatus Poseidoniaceae archaeon]
MEDALAGTTPFFTLDAILPRTGAVEKALLNDTWPELISNDDDLLIRLASQGIADASKRENIPWDDANLFFLSCIELNRQNLPAPLEAGISKERFGRFPYGDGSPLTYLKTWVRSSGRHQKEWESMEELLESLATRLLNTSLQSGVGRMESHGWLSNTEVTTLRKSIVSRCWNPSSDEPLDGGAHDAAKHLVALLRSAEKRDSGVLLRAHI